MPEMNGFDLCRKIKSQLLFSHIPVILLTALTDERQRIFGITGGADDYIQKPFHTDYVKNQDYPPIARAPEVTGTFVGEAAG